VTRVTASRLGMRSPWRMHTQRTSQADARCVSLMRAQDGLISRDQLELEGLGEAARRRRVRAGHLVPILPGVYRSLVTTESWRQFVRATWMWLRGRGVLSHLTSASLLGLVENEPLPIEVTSSLSSLKPPAIKWWSTGSNNWSNETSE
jgi:hypothetical protein